jgi:hypothetical protein
LSAFDSDCFAKQESNVNGVKPSQILKGSPSLDAVAIDMVRAGVVSHPSKWSFSGYNEIQEPRRKNVLIDYEKLQGLLAVGSYDQLRS